MTDRSHDRPAPISIRLETGHVQVRASSYERETVNLQWKDLLENPGQIAARAAGMAEAKTASAGALGR